MTFLAAEVGGIEGIVERSGNKRDRGRGGGGGSSDIVDVGLSVMERSGRASEGAVEGGGGG